MDNNQIIPFGKYKGKPISILQNDKEYLEWVMSQGWFIEKFQSLHTIIINNFETQNKTPEHNQFQEMFLDDNLISKIVYKETGLKLNEKIYTIRVENEFSGCWKILDKESVLKFIEDKNENLKILYLEALKFSYKTYFEYSYKNYYFDVFIRLSFESNYMYITPKQFKEKLLNSKLESEYFYTNYNICIELKPCIGDDYSSILRKIPEKSIVITKEYNGSVSFENVKKMFESKNVKLYLLSELTD